MSNIPLRDILISARQEAYRMRHFYLGVEHLFIALLEIKGGLASSIMEENGLATEYVIDAVRRKVGKGSRHRLWAGIPNTPRAEVILTLANEIAVEQSRKEITEQDLLVAILEENDNIPVRVLRALKQDINKIADEARHRTSSNNTQQSFVKIDFGPHFGASGSLSEQQLFVLRRMFYGYQAIRVERRLTGGYTNALILVVTPINTDEREDAAVVVKIDQADIILDEAQRYDSNVKASLPPFSARLVERPTAPETSDFAGIKYTFVGSNDTASKDLRFVAASLGSPKLADWLKHEFYPLFGKTWWQQRRPYRFQVWREYDGILPPLLTLELVDEKQIPANAHVLKMPIKRSRLKQLEYGDIVVIENFTVSRVYRERGAIQLATGHGSDAATAYKIEVRGIDLNKDAYYRGEVVERIAGKVYKTRSEYLVHAARALEPEFDLTAESIPSGLDAPSKLPNPLFAYEELLDRYMNGSLSKIHGDLHLGNIILGPNENPSLVDFAQTRDGHTIFDWVTLEISLLSDLVMTTTGNSWADARKVLQYLIALNDNAPLPQGDQRLSDAFSAIVTVREIARECLADPDDWAEYFAGLALCSLRALSWETMSVGARRLMFLLSALAVPRSQPLQKAASPSPDETEIGDNSN
ncbi:MAG: Clp protease N-terminal domain-containing protein [Anaerolineae bacterium]